MNLLFWEQYDFQSFSGWYICNGTVEVTYKEEKKENILSIHMTKSPSPTENLKKHSDNPKNAAWMFHHKAIADRLRAISKSNDRHPTGVVKPAYGITKFLITTKVE